MIVWVCHQLTTQDRPGAAAAIFFPGAALVVWAAVAVTLKRAQDTESAPRPGAVSGLTRMGRIGIVAVPVLVILWAFITAWLLVRRSAPGPNAFGPRPDSLPGEATGTQL